ncbi:MAG: pilus assembly protein PilP [Rhodocyclaceae bacterium]|nr:pilus assembly protein PilP [Rhodocyclaceae bacterium]MCB1902317.1 pilus assembly protein PilP [Rhodocyclaceae bacterium]MCP5310896.1 pilus assembly protein PilP [Zoogloeaceae bacterium]
MTFRILTVILLAPLLVSCSSPEQDIQEWMTEEASHMKGGVKPLPEIEPAPVVEFDETLVTDPFRPSKMEPDKRAVGGLRPDVNRRREPLEAFPLESLSFVGVIQRGKENLALVKAGEALYQVRKGNYLGQDFGVVTGISGAEVSIKELVEDMNGEWGERVSTLHLQEQETKK